jgi:hypothetical protein
VLSVAVSILLRENSDELPEVLASGSLPISDDVRPELGVRTADREIVGLLNTGPRLHVLQCVWRC